MRWQEWLGLAVMALVVIGVGYVMFGAKEASEFAYAPVDMEIGAIEIMEFNEEGTEVRMMVELEKAGFVSIHESLSGAPAEIIGVSELLEAGTKEAVVTVNPMMPGFSYIALLKVDNGDGEFVSSEDLPVRVNGAVVRPDFMFKPEAEFVPLPAEETAE